MAMVFVTMFNLTIGWSFLRFLAKVYFGFARFILYVVVRIGFVVSRIPAFLFLPSVHRVLHWGPVNVSSFRDSLSSTDHEMEFILFLVLCCGR